MGVGDVGLFLPEEGGSEVEDTTLGLAGSLHHGVAAAFEKQELVNPCHVLLSVSPNRC